MTSPLRPSISAGASGRSFPAANTNSGTDRSGISTSGYGLARATGTPSRSRCGASLTLLVAQATRGLPVSSRVGRDLRTGPHQGADENECADLVVFSGARGPTGCTG